MRMSSLKVAWSNYTVEEREVLGMTAKDPTLPTHEPALDQANSTLHSRQYSSMANGEIEGLIDSCKRAMCNKPIRLLGCERLFQKFSGFPNFANAQQHLKTQRLQVGLPDPLKTQILKWKYVPKGLWAMTPMIQITLLAFLEGICLKFCHKHIFGLGERVSHSDILKVRNSAAGISTAC